MKKFTYILLGTLCVFLAGIGIFLPVLPTTPFLLLAAFFYARSSNRFYTWLITNRVFGIYIRNYREGRGIPLRQKIIVISLLWLTIGSTALLVVTQLWLQILLFGIAAGVTIHLVKTKTYRPETNISPLISETDRP
jgi:hypothetical protein